MPLKKKGSKKMPPKGMHPMPPSGMTMADAEMQKMMGKKKK